jgi:hypothetical protein
MLASVHAFAKPGENFEQGGVRRYKFLQFPTVLRDITFHETSQNILNISHPIIEHIFLKSE